jgi:hypothetical protein
MAADAPGRRASELRSLSRDLALTAPRTAALLRGLADDLNRDASLTGLLGPGWLSRPLAGVRLLAGVHDLVLAGAVPQLEELMSQPHPDAAPAGGDVLWNTARQAIFDHPDQMRAAVQWPVQQHGPDRARHLLSGLAMLGQPRVRVLELGACAGLALLADEYRWQGPDWAWGASNSPVGFAIDCPPPPPGLQIVERAGCDIAPVDPGNPEMARRLHAFLPPELSQAHTDLDAALAIAASRPRLVERAGAQEWLERQLLGQAPLGVHTVVWHCHLWQLLEQAERDGIRDALLAAAGRFPITRISYEPYEPGGPATLTVESFREPMTPADTAQPGDAGPVRAVSRS